MLIALASFFIWCFTIFSGCSKCFKEFPRASFGDKPDFSGFDRESWERRSNEDHQAAAEKVHQAKTPSDAQKFASSSGARYSVLFQLHYGMWTAFVHACQLLCKKVITKEECLEADQKLM